MSLARTEKTRLRLVPDLRPPKAAAEDTGLGALPPDRSSSSAVELTYQLLWAAQESPHLISRTVSRHNPREIHARAAFGCLIKQTFLQHSPQVSGSRPTVRVISEAIPLVARMPPWVTGLKVSIAGALLAWVFFG